MARVLIGYMFCDVKAVILTSKLFYNRLKMYAFRESIRYFLGVWYDSCVCTMYTHISPSYRFHVTGGVNPN